MSNRLNHDVADCPEDAVTASRRSFLSSAGNGFGQLALLSLLLEDSFAQAAPRRPAARKSAADSVIFLFMRGGPSHIDLFDPKPALQKYAGQPLPKSLFGKQPVTTRPILASTQTFRRSGRSGLEISELCPALARHADELCVLRSCVGESGNHDPAITAMNTGSIRVGRPSLGAWTLYGLGSAPKDLPGFVVLKGSVVENTRPDSWGAGFLPPSHQGTLFRNQSPPIANLTPPKGSSRREEALTLDFIRSLNARYRLGREANAALASRVSAYELAFRMQARASEVADFSKETPATRKLYGLDDRITGEMGRSCLLARRLVERGVRFVQIYCANWDSHVNLPNAHAEICAHTDTPVAGLLADLKSRGLLDRTLVLWGGEFGRTPTSISGTGRDHNPTGFTMWMAGGGVRGGQVIGTTDDFGRAAVDEPAHVNDLHATLLHQMGLNASQVTMRVNGRDEHPTVNGGSIITRALRSHPKA